MNTAGIEFRFIQMLGRESTKILQFRYEEMDVVKGYYWGKWQSVPNTAMTQEKYLEEIQP